MDSGQSKTHTRYIPVSIEDAWDLAVMGVQLYFKPGLIPFEQSNTLRPGRITTTREKLLRNSVQYYIPVE